MKKLHLLIPVAAAALLATAAVPERPAPKVKVAPRTVAALKAAAEAEIPADWVEMGEGSLTEDILAIYSPGGDPPTYTVKVEQDRDKSGWYRIVNPFAGNPLVDEYGCDVYDDKDYYLYIDATDPGHVHVPMSELGVEVFGDAYSLVSMSLYPNPYEFYYDEDEAAAMAGSLQDGVITFETEEALVLVCDFGAEATNASGAFRLVLPSGEEPGPGPEPGPDPVVPPFEESFSTSDFTETFTILDVNGDGTRWEPYLGSAQVSYNSDMAMDDWLITPPLALEGGKKYVLSLELLTGSGSDKERFEVKFGTSNTVDAMTQCVIEPMEIAHTKYVSYSGTITPDESGVYYVGIHGCSDADKYSLSVKNLKIAEGAEAATPAAPEELTVVTRTNGELKADISVKAPTADLDGGMLESLDAVRLMREGETVHTFLSPTPGEVLTYVDEVPDCNRYSYTAVAVLGEMESAPVETRAFVGVLEPAAPASVTVRDGDEPGTVTVEWEPVTADMRGNELDPQYVSYRIYVAGEPRPIHEGLTSASHTFKAVEDVAEQTFVRYEVVAETRGGLSDYVSTPHHPVGAAYVAPYRESYADGTARYIFANEAGYEAEWAAYCDDPEIKSQDDDNGFMACEASYLEDAGMMTTGKIDLSGLDKPELSLWVYVIAGDEKDTNELHIGVICDGKSSPLAGWVIGDLSDTEGWQRVSADMEAYKDKTVRLSFKTVHNLMPYVFIDNVAIDNAKADGIGSVAADSDGTVEYYNLQGVRVDNPSGGVYIRRQGNVVTKTLIRR